jgi:hypothetical protein
MTRRLMTATRHLEFTLRERTNGGETMAVHPAVETYAKGVVEYAEGVLSVPN